MYKVISPRGKTATKAKVHYYQIYKQQKEMLNYNMSPHCLNCFLKV